MKWFSSVHLIACACLVYSSLLWAHGGGVDVNGCHTKRATGEYHCHGGSRPDAAKNATTASPSPPPSKKVSGQTCFVGPRGGTYTITKSGRKNYSGC